MALASGKARNGAAHADEAHQRRRRQPHDLAEAAVDGFGEIEHGVEPLAHARRHRCVGLCLGDATAQHGQRRVDLARLAPLRDAPDHLEHVGFGLVVVAPVAHGVHAADEVPRQKLAQAGRYVGARHAEAVGDVLGRERRFAEVEQGVDLRDGAVDAPRTCPSRPSAERSAPPDRVKCQSVR